MPKMKDPALLTLTPSNLLDLPEAHAALFAGHNRPPPRRFPLSRRRARHLSGDPPRPLTIVCCRNVVRLPSALRSQRRAAKEMAGLADGVGAGERHEVGGVDEARVLEGGEELVDGCARRREL